MHSLHHAHPSIRVGCGPGVLPADPDAPDSEAGAGAGGGRAAWREGARSKHAVPASGVDWAEIRGAAGTDSNQGLSLAWGPRLPASRPASLGLRYSQYPSSFARDLGIQPPNFYPHEFRNMACSCLQSQNLEVGSSSSNSVIVSGLLALEFCFVHSSPESRFNLFLQYQKPRSPVPFSLRPWSPGLQTYPNNTYHFPLSGLVPTAPCSCGQGG